MRKEWKKITAIVLLVIIIAGFFIPVPYYISKPGGTEELAPLVSVENHPNNKDGSLSLVTIAMGKANIYTYMAAKFLPYRELEKDSEIKYEDETDEEYNVRQMQLMNESKNNAIQIAYKAAGQEVKVTYDGVYVLSVMEDVPAAKVLHAGDLITEIDGHSFQSSQEFIDYIHSKKVGDTVKIKYKHGDKKEEASIKLTAIDKKGTPGIGITLVDDEKITAVPEVKIDSEKIGGPSAGLMFSLEIYSRFQKDDLTDGKKIAGTGTIDTDGTVGRIGGIDQKVVAADKSGAKIFFAPNDTITKEMKESDATIESNYDTAVKTAKDIDSKMKIVPVKTFQDALDYLNKLP
ncbi:SepM family pheromone-processing serine protease [Listeria immobilis]|uniref:SepM family pheromone-processing serine protease n=1 Tax=Listeria immobilis TaxID=2713502 RepID=UPI001623A5A7|nr:SepM family pheromone-processing serine protease [Listeria immobilis]MBC1516784.1 PDZ domain-containing protein [Listeria immobilis]